MLLMETDGVRMFNTSLAGPYVWIAAGLTENSLRWPPLSVYLPATLLSRPITGRINGDWGRGVGLKNGGD